MYRMGMGCGVWKRVWDAILGEKGFTLLEAMLGIMFLLIGLLAVADVFPRGLSLGRYGKDQTVATSLAVQEVEDLKNSGTTFIQGKVGDYASAGTVATVYFKQDGTQTTQADPLAYFARDVQVQYWTWNSTTSQFVLPTSPASPYTAPASGTAYVYRVSVATHWLVRGQTSFVSGQATNGCVNNTVAAPTGIGCVQFSTYVSP
jgi:Tfp pilus assembly protein PilV